jgi:hypothetical protein
LNSALHTQPNLTQSHQVLSDKLVNKKNLSTVSAKYQRVVPDRVPKKTIKKMYPINPTAAPISTPLVYWFYNSVGATQRTLPATIVKRSEKPD